MCRRKRGKWCHCHSVGAVGASAEAVPTKGRANALSILQKSGLSLHCQFLYVFVGILFSNCLFWYGEMQKELLIFQSIQLFYLLGQSGSFQFPYMESQKLEV